MADHVTLLGAEQVANAGHAMSRAAAEMQQAAVNFDGAIHRMAQLVERIEVAMQPPEVLVAEAPSSAEQDGPDRCRPVLEDGVIGMKVVGKPNLYEATGQDFVTARAFDAYRDAIREAFSSECNCDRPFDEDPGMHHWKGCPRQVEV